MSLNGKVAIVTGASRGIGKAMPMGLAMDGAQVLVAARSEELCPMCCLASVSVDGLSRNQDRQR